MSWFDEIFIVHSHTHWGASLASFSGEIFGKQCANDMCMLSGRYSLGMPGVKAMDSSALNDDKTAAIIRTSA